MIQKRRVLKQKLFEKREREKEDEKMWREGVPEIIFDEDDDGYSGSDSVEVDEIALVAVPMPAFAENVISGNDEESNQEKDGNDAVSDDDENDDELDGDGMESEEEGEGQGFDESDWLKFGIYSIRSVCCCPKNTESII